MFKRIMKNKIRTKEFKRASALLQGNFSSSVCSFLPVFFFLHFIALPLLAFMSTYNYFLLIDILSLSLLLLHFFSLFSFALFICVCYLISSC
jgi:hypothetical protein